MTTWQDIPGWTCPRIIELYDEMARELKPGAVAVECGVAYGKSLAYLASVIDPGVDILAVDIWQTFQGRTTQREAFVSQRARYMSPMEAARGNVEMSLGGSRLIDPPPDIEDYAPWNPLLERVEFVQARSEDVPKYLDFDVDFVFLDDHHEEESVYAEIMAWLPRLKSGGVIAGHDINDHYPGVARGVERAIAKSRGMTHLPNGFKAYGIEVRPPAEGENGWGGVWKFRKP